MEKFDNVYVIDYWDLDDTEFQKSLFKTNYDPSENWLDEIRNDTIYNCYPYEIRPFDFTNSIEAKLAYAFICWFIFLEDGKEWFEDFLGDDLKLEYKEYSKLCDPIEMLMRWMCTVNEIPEGNYFIRISW